MEPKCAAEMVHTCSERVCCVCFHYMYCGHVPSRLLNHLWCTVYLTSCICHVLVSLVLVLVLC